MVCGFCPCAKFAHPDKMADSDTGVRNVRPAGRNPDKPDPKLRNGGRDISDTEIRVRM